MYGQLVGQVDFPNGDKELHHFGWNACSACLCPQASHPHMERRYLIVPGIASSRIHVLDTRPNPRQPRIVKVIEPEEFIRKTGYTAPHTIHCGPDGVYGSALGSASGDGPGGIFLMDAETFELKGQWEKDRGPQQLAYDFWWHLGRDTMVTSEWGTPNMVKDGVNPELLLGGKYGHKLHIWNLDTRRHLQELDLGAEQPMVLELRPSHDPTKTYGFAGVVVSLKDLSSSIWMWHRADGGKGKNGHWAIHKVIEIPAEPQVGFRDLTLWSLLMASAHGAGFMVLPVLLGSSAVEAADHAAGHNHLSAGASPLAGLLATGVHTIGYLAVTGVVAWVVYRRLGLALLRHAWLNLDLVWAAALVVTGVITLMG